MPNLICLNIISTSPPIPTKYFVVVGFLQRMDLLVRIHAALGLLACRLLAPSGPAGSALDRHSNMWARTHTQGNKRKTNKQTYPFFCFFLCITNKTETNKAPALPSNKSKIDRFGSGEEKREEGTLLIIPPLLLHLVWERLSSTRRRPSWILPP